jgi:hypothetical protein
MRDDLRFGVILGRSGRPEGVSGKVTRSYFRGDPLGMSKVGPGGLDLALEPGLLPLIALELSPEVLVARMLDGFRDAPGEGIQLPEGRGVVQHCDTANGSEPVAELNLG